MKQKRFLMGIDNGGSNVKCAIFDLDGEEVAAAGVRLSSEQHRAGFVERDPERVWRCNCDVIAEALHKAGIRPCQIAAISLCGYGGGLCLVDESGTPVYPIVVSTDTRAHSQLKQLRSSGAAHQVFETTHQQLWEGQPAVLLKWFREERPEILRQARYALTIKDFIRSRLTQTFATDVTDASNNNLIDPTTGSYSEQLFHISGLDADRRLFDYPLLRPDSVVGSVTKHAAEETGLAPGTPVAAGLYDVSACTMGCGALGHGTLAITNGTWSMASYFGTSFSHAANSTIVTVSAIDGCFLLEQGSATGTVNLNWYLDNFISKMHPRWTKQQLYGACAEAIRKVNPQNNIVFVPYLYASCTHPDAKGTFFNLLGYHNEMDLLYAIMEGILLSARHHIKLLEHGIAPFQTAYLSGGVSASPEWSQMLCDILQIPISITKGSQQGARGAAMCAGVAVQEFDHFSQAADAMVHTSSTLYPRAEHRDFYSQKIEIYENALQALDYFYELT